MATLGQAYVQIIPSADGISGQISNVLNGPADTAGKTAGNKFGAGFGGNVKKGLIAAGVGVTALGAAAGAALTKSIGDAAEYGDRVDKLSQKIGFSAEGFQKWDYVLQRAGTSIDSMAPVMKKLSTAAVENSDAFQKLGISQEEVANMSQEDLFGRTIEALSGMEAGVRSEPDASVQRNDRINRRTETGSSRPRLCNVRRSGQSVGRFPGRADDAPGRDVRL